MLKFSLEKPLEPEALHSHIHESGLSEEAAVLSALPAVQKIVEADDGHEIWLQLCADVSARLQQQQQRQQQLAQLQKELNKKELASTDRR